MRWCCGLRPQDLKALGAVPVKTFAGVDFREMGGLEQAPLPARLARAARMGLNPVTCPGRGGACRLRAQLVPDTQDPRYRPAGAERTVSRLRAGSER